MRRDGPRVLIFGNSGSGKTTLARALAASHEVPLLELDAIVWVPGKVAVQRPREATQESLEDFLGAHDAWIVEGCYGELIREASRRCSELVFLNPGLDACLQNNRRRPWEPEKYASAELQDSNLDALQEWVAEYYTRDDDWSYRAHRRVFDAHAGAKVEHTTTPPRPGAGGTGTGG